MSTFNAYNCSLNCLDKEEYNIFKDIPTIEENDKEEVEENGNKIHIKSQREK